MATMAITMATMAITIITKNDNNDVDDTNDVDECNGFPYRSSSIEVFKHEAERRAINEASTHAGNEDKGVKEGKRRRLRGEDDAERQTKAAKRAHHAISRLLAQHRRQGSKEHLDGGDDRQHAGDGHDRGVRKGVEETFEEQAE